MKTKHTQTPLILATDSYKISQWLQYPEGYTNMYSYIESRGGEHPDAMFFGLQIFIKKYLLQPITKQDVEFAKIMMDAHLGPDIFNYEGWMSIVEKFDGNLPIRIRAVKEGSVIPVKNALVTVENTEEGYGWLTSYLETSLLREVWYATTIATYSYECKKVIYDYLLKTSDDPDANITFALHDFGYRGVSSDESAQTGGLAHLINFKGSDTMAALVAACEYYNATGPVGYSVIAAEHSTMCANADAENKNDYKSAERMVGILEERQKKYGGFNIVAAVADTYDVYRFAKQFIGTDLKERIINSGGRFVVRPDSGNPEIVPVTIVKLLMETFGYTINSKGYKVLPSCIRVLQGDGINLQSIKNICRNASLEQLSIENFVFGCGGKLLQAHDRDEMKFAMKGSAIKVNGIWKDIFKDPITDSGKQSKKGRITTVRDLNSGKIYTKRINEMLSNEEDLLYTYFENGQLTIDLDFESVRANADSNFR